MRNTSLEVDYVCEFLNIPTFKLSFSLLILTNYENIFGLSNKSKLKICCLHFCKSGERLNWAQPLIWLASFIWNNLHFILDRTDLRYISLAVHLLSDLVESPGEDEIALDAWIVFKILISEILLNNSHAILIRHSNEFYFLCKFLIFFCLHLDIDRSMNLLNPQQIRFLISINFLIAIRNEHI